MKIAFFAILSFGLMQEAAPEKKSLDVLCAEYEALSIQLTADYTALQRASLNSERGEGLMEEIKANSTYSKTRIQFKQVVKELGTRSCPVDMEEDFPPLL